jgi:hypothetical protein
LRGEVDTAVLAREVEVERYSFDSFVHSIRFFASLHSLNFDEFKLFCFGVEAHMRRIKHEGVSNIYRYSGTSFIIGDGMLYWMDINKQQNIYRQQHRQTWAAHCSRQITGARVFVSLDGHHFRKQ